MNYRQFSALFLVFLSLSFANLIHPVLSVGDTEIITSPGYAYGYVNQSLIVNITVQDVTDLLSWQVKLSFNPEIINCTEVFVPSDNIFSGHTTTFGYETDYGLVKAFSGSWSASGVNGSGKLCSIAFQALHPGISALSFLDEAIDETYLLDSDNDPISFQKIDGAIQIDGAGFNLNIFLISSGGTPYNITVFSNSSITNFNFNSTLQEIRFNASGALGTQGSCTVIIPQALLNGIFTVLIDHFSVYHSVSIDDLRQYLLFDYQHTTTEPMQIEVLTTIVGDLNGDRKVNMRDVAIAARAFGTTPGDPGWDPRGDTTGPEGYPDAKVDMRDIASVARRFGNEWIP